MVLPPPTPDSALLVMDVGNTPRFVDAIGRPPVDLLEANKDWIALALRGPTKLGPFRVTTLRRHDWLLGFSFVTGKAKRTWPCSWSPPALPAFRVLLDEHYQTMGSSRPMDDLADDLECAARRSAGRSFLWRGLWADWQRLGGKSSHHWLLDLKPARRATPPAFSLLTRRQRETCMLARLGLTIAEIADSLGCGSETARTHLKGAYRSLGVATRVELVEPAAEWECWTQLDLPI